MGDNRAAFERFVDLFYTQKRVADAFATLVADDYRQHNPTIVDGPGPAPDAADIYRFEGGRIVEHWDVLQPVPETSVHDHPMF